MKALDNFEDIFETETDPSLENEYIEQPDFLENLAEKISESNLGKIASFLTDAIKEDLDSRREWFESIEKVEKYLGFSLEDLDSKPFKQATRTFDTTLSTALMRGYATARMELLPATGPASYEIMGERTEEYEQIGEKRKNWLNYYLTVLDEGYYADFEKCLFHLILGGTVFKKVFIENVDGRPFPRSRFILPKDFIIDMDCTSILESNRLTQVLHLSKRDILMRQQNGVFLKDVKLPYLKDGTVDDDDDDETEHDSGIDTKAYTKRSLFQFYECHTYLSLEDFTESNGNRDKDDIPLPYIIVIDKTTTQVMSIRRNWDESDENKKRKNYFVQYNYLCGSRILGYGLAHLLGTNAISLTKILRQTVDAATFQNLPGGFRAKGLKEQKTDILVGAGEWYDVDTNGIPLRDAFLPLPFNGPSPALLELQREIRGMTKELGSISELGFIQSKEDVPAQTALIAIENQNKIQSVSLKSMYMSLAQELRLLDEIFGRNLDVENFYFAESQQEITQDDFVKEVVIVPVSDPSINSTIQNLVRANSVLQTAREFPQFHNIRAALANFYTAVGLAKSKVEEILIPDPKEPPEIPILNPLSENARIIMGQPVKVAAWQDDEAHNMVHGSDQTVASSPEGIAHMKEHEANRMLKMMLQEMGLPIDIIALEQITDPQAQNDIAVRAAEAAQRLMQQQQEQNPAPLDPNAVMMADIQQRQAEVEARERIANLKAETDALKAQLNLEIEKAKIESNEDIAQLKAETELTKSGL